VLREGDVNWSESRCQNGDGRRVKQPHAHARDSHGLFLRLKLCDVKTAEFCETQRKPEMAEHLAHATVRNSVKMRAKTLLN